MTLDLQEFEYNEQVMDVMAQCSPLLTISALWIRGVSYNAGSTHEHVLRILEVRTGSYDPKITRVTTLLRVQRGGDHS